MNMSSGRQTPEKSPVASPRKYFQNGKKPPGAQLGIQGGLEYGERSTISQTLHGTAIGLPPH